MPELLAVTDWEGVTVIEPESVAVRVRVWLLVGMALLVCVMVDVSDGVRVLVKDGVGVLLGEHATFIARRFTPP